VLVEGRAMDEAVRTTASPAAIWVIVGVMSVMTMILISAAAIADSWQARVDRRERGSGLGPAIADVFTHAGSLGAEPGRGRTGAGRTGAGGASAGGASAGATDAGGASAGGPAVAENTAADSMAADGSTGTGQRASSEPVPAQRAGSVAGPRPTAGEPSAGEPASDEQQTGRHRRMEADPAGETPTLPDLPPVSGRHAMPPPRSGDTDRPERSRTGTAGTPEDDPGQH
jgi:hypothetical protein